MVQSVKATYRDGVLEPSEELDLEDGESVVVTVSGRGVTEEESVAGDVQGPEADVGDRGGESSSSSDNGEHPLLQRLRKIRESVPASAWDGVPKDGSINYKHYLYGHPKVDWD